MEILLQIVLAVIVGGLIGMEREFRTGIGLRTLMLICLGATLFTIYGNIWPSAGDPSRIASSVVAGVGFLGAGMIIRHRSGIFGLTTAATVWLVAALGMGIGIREYLMVAVAVALVLLVLWIIPKLLQAGDVRRTMTYEVLGPREEMQHQELLGLLTENHLQVTRSTMAKEENGIRYTWQSHGRLEDHDSIMVALIDHELVKEFRVLVFDEFS